MVHQEHHVEPAATGPCSDCGTVADRRVGLLDGFTHSTVQLCLTCWNAHRQRQVFAGGCCG